MTKSDKTNLICQKMTALSNVLGENNQNFPRCDRRVVVKDGTYTLRYYSEFLEGQSLYKAAIDPINKMIDALREVGPGFLKEENDCILFYFTPTRSADEVLRALDDAIRSVETPFGFCVPGMEALFKKLKRSGPHARRQAKEQEEAVKEYLSMMAATEFKSSPADVTYNEESPLQNGQLGPQFTMTFTLPPPPQGVTMPRLAKDRLDKIFGMENVRSELRRLIPERVRFYINLDPHDAHTRILKHNPRAFAGRDDGSNKGVGRL